MTGVSSSCGACKFLRRRCTEECIFAPYFTYEEATAHFAAVHKVFGASNVSKLLSHLPEHCRSDAAITISYEALARMQDPIYGCIAHIFALQQQVASLEDEIEMFGKQMTDLGINCETSNPYFSAESEMSRVETGPQPILHPEIDLGMNDEIFEGYLFERIVEQVSQDCHLHQDYNNLQFFV